MSGDSAASAPGEPGAVRGGLSAGRWRAPAGGGLFEGGLLQGGVQGSPVLRLFMRWVRRPLLPVMRLWRRNIQLRVVATTLLMSLGVVLLLGFVVIGQVRNGLLDAKVQGRAEPGRRRVRGGQAEGGRGGQRRRATTVPARTAAPRQNVIQWLSDLVEPLASGGQGAFDVVTLSADSAATAAAAAAGRGPPGGVRPDGERARGPARAGRRAAPAASRATPGSSTTTASESAAGAGHRQAVNDPNGDPYQLYYLFPLTQEEKSLEPGQGHAGDGRAVRRRAARAPSPGWWCGRSSRPCGWRPGSPSGCPPGGCRSG